MIAGLCSFDAAATVRDSQGLPELRSMDPDPNHGSSGAGATLLGRRRRRRGPIQSFILAVDVVQRGYQLWTSTKQRFSPTERQRLFGLTVLIGGVCGLVAVAFHESIRLVESLTIDRAFASSGDTWII